MTYIVYILKTSGDTYYVGQTNNIQRRIDKHRSGKGAKYLRMFDSFELVYKELCESRSKALVRESEIKKMSKKQKIVLVLGKTSEM